MDLMSSENRVLMLSGRGFPGFYVIFSVSPPHGRRWSRNAKASKIQAQNKRAVFTGLALGWGKLPRFSLAFVPDMPSSYLVK